LEKLQQIIIEAIENGADGIEMEYVGEGLEVTYMFGNIGMGRVIEDEAEIGEIITGIMEDAKLESTSQGLMEWRHKSHKIYVEAYDSFGETAFRLKIKAPK
jgi:division protein CdvB (Snf7/Vps24/ESCRT-III family)